MLLGAQLGWAADGDTFVSLYKKLKAQESRYAGQVDFDTRLARAAIRTGQLDHALFVLERVRAQDPGNMEALLLMVEVYLRQGREKQALDVLKALPLQQAPPKLRQRLIRLIEKLQQPVTKRRWQGLLSVQAGWESNPELVGDRAHIPLVLPGASAPITLLAPSQRAAAFGEIKLRLQSQQARRLFLLAFEQRAYGERSGQENLIPLDRVDQRGRLLLRGRQLLSGCNACWVEGTLSYSWGLGTPSWQVGLALSGLSRPLFWRLALRHECGEWVASRQPNALSIRIGRRWRVLDSWQMELHAAGEYGWGEQRAPVAWRLGGGIRLFDGRHWQMSLAWQQQLDSAPWFPVLFGDQRRDLTTVMLNLGYQRRLIDRLMLQSGLVVRRDDSEITFYTRQNVEVTLGLAWQFGL